MNENNHLPVFGIGPYLIGSTTLITVLSIFLSINKLIPVFNINQINFLLNISGIILIFGGALLWLAAVLKSRIGENIKDNKLVTTGIYGVVRHPIYAAFLYAITGFILISNNIFLFSLPVIYWIIFTVVMIKTEEKWLFELYGDDYVDYSKEVNRFIPFLKV